MPFLRWQSDSTTISTPRGEGATFSMENILQGTFANGHIRLDLPSSCLTAGSEKNRPL
jgi:hypothetical protein